MSERLAPNIALHRTLVALLWCVALCLGGCESCIDSGVIIGPPPGGGSSSGGGSGGGSSSGGGGSSTGGGGGGTTTTPPVVTGPQLEIVEVAASLGWLAISVEYTADPDEDAVGLQFDVDYDATLLGTPTVTAGTAAPSSGVTSNTTTAGKARIAALDLGLAPIGSGGIATLAFPITGASGTPTTFSLSAVTAGDATGSAISVTTVDLDASL